MTCWRCWFCGPRFLPCQSYSQETMRNNGEWRRGRVWLFLSHVSVSIFNEVKKTFFLLSLDVFHGCLKLKFVFVCNMLLVRSYRLVCSGRGLKQGNVYEFKNLGMLVLLGWESGASFVSQWQSVKWTYQSSKHIIICSHILWDKWRACL